MTMKKLVALVVFVGVFASVGISDTPSKEKSEFVFARVQFNMTFESVAEPEEPWHHDYPYAEDLYLSLIREVTGVFTSEESYVIVRLDEDEIFKYPFLYVSEPGYMDLTEKELTNLREYFNRGGFMILDDFRGRDLNNLRAQMKRVFPQREMFKLDVTHPVFHSYYDLDSIDMDSPYSDSRFSGRPEFWGLQDEQGTLILLANQNNDLGEFWEWLDKGEMPLQPAAKSVRLGINYLIYAMTH